MPVSPVPQKPLVTQVSMSDLKKNNTHGGHI